MYFSIPRLLYQEISVPRRCAGLLHKIMFNIRNGNFVNVVLYLFRTDVREIWSSECLLNRGRTAEGTKGRERMVTWWLLDLLCIHVRQNHDNCIEIRNCRTLCSNLISKCGNPFVWTIQLRKRRTICVGRHSRRIFCCMKSLASGARWREL
jgi:hypothetical protein